MKEKTLLFIQKYLYYILGAGIAIVLAVGSFLILSLTSGGTSIQSEILETYSLNEENIDNFDVKKDYNLDYINDIKFSEQSSISSSIESSSSSSVSSVDNSDLIDNIDKVLDTIANFSSQNGVETDLEIIEFIE